MTKKTIEIIVDHTGRTRVETKGFTGAECQDASRFMEYALGGRVKEELLPSYYSTTESSMLHQRQD